VSEVKFSLGEILKLKKTSIIFALVFSLTAAGGPGFAVDEVNTIITQFNETGNFLRSDPVDIQIKHPTSIECDQYKAPTSKLDEDYGGRNCSFSIEYLLASTGSKIDFFASGLVTNSAGEKIGEFASLIMVSDKYGLNQWKKATVTARLQNSGEMFLGLAPFSTRTYGVKLQRAIKANVITAEEADRRKAAQEAADAKAAADALLAEKKLLASKKLSIVCSKGAAKKVVTGDPPKCPSGYAFGGNSYLTYKAFATCKLYKKDSLFAGAALSDGSKTLELIRYGKGFMLGHLNDADFNCAMKVLSVSTAVKNQIFSTRAIDGQQKARVGAMTASWTYHPDTGLNITFTYVKI
jgi:hypothetical protein